MERKQKVKENNQLLYTQLDLTVPCVFICYTLKSLKMLVLKVPMTKYMMVYMKAIGKMHMRYLLLIKLLLLEIRTANKEKENLD